MLVVAVYVAPAGVAVNPPQVTPSREVIEAHEVPSGEVLGLLVVKLELNKTRAQNLCVLLLPSTIRV